jgi:hypothetical protein
VDDRGAIHLNYAFPLDPAEVLGVAPDASLQQIHEAYRAKSRKHHPDVGGDEWAFRIVARSYELLSTARVMGRASEEMTHGTPPPSRGQRDRQVRTGVRDTAVPPDRLVAVEMLLLRYELDGPLELMMEPAEERNLSCTLNVSWPIPGSSSSGGPARPIRDALDAAFRETIRRTAPTASRADHDDIGRFIGWLSYPTALKADEAFKAFQAALRARNLGVTQTIREVTVPREWA